MSSPPPLLSLKLEEAADIFPTVFPHDVPADIMNQTIHRYETVLLF